MKFKSLISLGTACVVALACKSTNTEVSNALDVTDHNDHFLTLRVDEHSTAYELVLCEAKNNKLPSNLDKCIPAFLQNGKSANFYDSLSHPMENLRLLVLQYKKPNERVAFSSLSFGLLAMGLSIPAFQTGMTKPALFIAGVGYCAAIAGCALKTVQTLQYKLYLQKVEANDKDLYELADKTAKIFDKNKKVEVESLSTFLQDILARFPEEDNFALNPKALAALTK